MPQKTVIIIAGPTASGKSDLAFQLAEHFGTSIISADSRQCFRELHIGVAKPDEKQLSAIPHFFIDSHSIHDEVNAALFEQLALGWCDDIFSTRDVAVLCGGTGLYIKAFRDGLDEIPVVSESVRSQIISTYQGLGMTWLQEVLQIEDPLYISSGDMQNPQRMMRALEVVRSTGRSIISYRSNQKKHRSFRMLEYGIQLPKKELHHRINLRVDLMMEKGLLEEAKSLLSFQHLNALQTVGYTELFDFLQGKTDYENSVLHIKQNTRHYAKRQLTWFKKNAEMRWLENDFLHQIIKDVSA